MRIEIPKIVKKIALAEYAEEFGEQIIEVWVNPTRELLAEFGDLNVRSEELLKKIRQPVKSDNLIEQLQADSDLLQADVAHWYAMIWSQGENPVSPKEVTELFNAAQESDPGFQKWLVDKTWTLIREHREVRKNA